MSSCPHLWDLKLMLTNQQINIPYCLCLTLLVGCQEEHLACKIEWRGAVWLSNWSKVQMIYIWSNWCHCQPHHLSRFHKNIQNCLDLWCQLTQVIVEETVFLSTTCNVYSILLSCWYAHYVNYWVLNILCISVLLLIFFLFCRCCIFVQLPVCCAEGELIVVYVTSGFAAGPLQWSHVWHNYCSGAATLLYCACDGTNAIAAPASPHPMQSAQNTASPHRLFWLQIMWQSLAAATTESQGPESSWDHHAV